MTWSATLRRTHRWLGIVFTVSIIATTVALMRAEPVVWMSYVPLLPLALLLLTGLYLFTLPGAARRRARRRSAQEQ